MRNTQLPLVGKCLLEAKQGKNLETDEAFIQQSGPNRDSP